MRCVRRVNDPSGEIPARETVSAIRPPSPLPRANPTLAKVFFNHCLCSAGVARMNSTAWAARAPTIDGGAGAAAGFFAFAVLPSDSQEPPPGGALAATPGRLAGAAAGEGAWTEGRTARAPAAAEAPTTAPKAMRAPRRRHGRDEVMPSGGGWWGWLEGEEGREGARE